MDNQKLLTMAEVREFLGGRSRSAVYSDIATGRLPQPFRFGGRIFWRADELQSHLDGLIEAQRFQTAEIEP